MAFPSGGCGCGRGGGGFQIPASWHTGGLIGADGSPQYFRIAGQLTLIAGPTETDNYSILAKSTTLSLLAFRCNMQSGSAGNTVTITFRINGANGLQSVTLTKLLNGAETLTGQDVVNTDPVTVFDLLDYQLTGTNGDVATQINDFQLCMVAS